MRILYSKENYHCNRCQYVATACWSHLNPLHKISFRCGFRCIFSYFTNLLRVIASKVKTK